jgi:anti-sigma factor RsiW
MRCKKSEMTASAHLDRQLTRNEARNYQAHIENCDECRAHLIELEQMSLILKSAQRLDASPELRSYVMSVITAK